jgi:acyl-CoA synthetase (AMP-forming)/AMP-acid ligase II
MFFKEVGYMKINIGKILANRAYLSPGLEAFSGADYRFNFREADRRANRFGSFLKAKGLVSGNRIAVLCKNNEHAATALFGAAKIGVITLMLNWRLQVPELAYILNDSGAALLIYDQEFAPAVDALKQQTEVKNYLSVEPGNKDNDFEKALACASPAEPAYEGSGSDPAVLMYTSGTTGRPKGVMLTHDNLFWASIGLTHTIDWAYKYRFLSVAPLFHIGGLAPIFGNVHSGCTTFFVSAFDPVKIWDVIVDEKINFMMSVPAMLQFMLWAPDISKKDLSALKHIVCGGSAVPQSLIATYDQMGIKVEQVYGITEYSGAVTFWTPDMGMEKSNSAGKTVFHGRVKILRPESDEEMPTGEVGEICCFGPQVFKGYWNNPEATSAVVGKGYYRSGDMGKIDPDGFLYVVDRLKDMIISGSENIYPAELEQVLMNHPGIADVAVVGKADAKWGEIPVAFVVKKADAVVTPEEIISHCRKNLAAYKCIKEVQFVQVIPKNSLGKVLKKELRLQLS